MAITGVGNYAQSAAVKSPVQGNTAFEQQNTQEQQAVSNGTQPREAEIAESVSADNEGQQFAREDQSFDATSLAEQGLDRNSPRGSVVDIVA